MRADSSASLAILCSPAVFKLYLQSKGSGQNGNCMEVNWFSISYDHCKGQMIFIYAKSLTIFCLSWGLLLSACPASACCFPLSILPWSVVPWQPSYAELCWACLAVSKILNLKYTKLAIRYLPCQHYGVGEGGDMFISMQRLVSEIIFMLLIYILLIWRLNIFSYKLCWNWKVKQTMWNLAVNMFPNKTRQNQGFLWIVDL